MVFKPAWQAILLGGLPHADETGAMDAVLARFADLPSWPQLPQRSPLENMYTMFAERFPGLREDAGSAFVQHGGILEKELGDLHLAYLDNDISYARMDPDHASCLYALLQHFAAENQPILEAVKGEVTGPVSWALTMLDEQRRPILYDRVLEDATAQHLRLKAAWQEQQLSEIASETIIILNEPYMASFGSSFVPLSRERAVALFNEVLAGIQGIGGVHCCGAADWSVILDARVQLLSWDAYDYMDTFLECAERLGQFLERGGILCWGIVPAGYAARKESVETLVTRLEQGIASLADEGISRELILRQSLVSPSCGLGSLQVPLAEHILDLTREVSETMQQRYVQTSQDGEASTDADSSLHREVGPEGGTS